MYMIYAWLRAVLLIIPYAHLYIHVKVWFWPTPTMYVASACFFCWLLLPVSCCWVYLCLTATVRLATRQQLWIPFVCCRWLKPFPHFSLCVCVLLFRCAERQQHHRWASREKCCVNDAPTALSFSSLKGGHCTSGSQCFCCLQDVSSLYTHARRCTHKHSYTHKHTQIHKYTHIITHVHAGLRTVSSSSMSPAASMAQSICLLTEQVIQCTSFLFTR